MNGEDVPICPDCGCALLDISTLGTYVKVPCDCDDIEDGYQEYSNIE